MGMPNGVVKMLAVHGELGELLAVHGELGAAGRHARVRQRVQAQRHSAWAEVRGQQVQQPNGGCRWSLDDAAGQDAAGAAGQDAAGSSAADWAGAGAVAAGDLAAALAVAAAATAAVSGASELGCRTRDVRAHTASVASPPASSSA